MGDPGEMTNPKLKTKLWEYGNRRRTDGPYVDNLEVDALVVGGGFGGVFCFYSLRKAGLKTVIYEAGTDLGGTWRWNCYRKPLSVPSMRFDSSPRNSWCHGRLGGSRIPVVH